MFAEKPKADGREIKTMAEKTTTTTTTKVWAPNPTQQLFLKTVKENPDRTLDELSEIAGVKFTSGCINTLANKGLIDNSQKKKVARVVYKEVSVYSVIE